MTVRTSVFFRLTLGALGLALLSSCTPRATQDAAITPAPPKVVDTIYVPGSDDKLHPKKVSVLAQNTQLQSGGNPAPALDEIIKMAPKWFPKGSHVEDVKENGDTITILMSPEFGDPKHWAKGETTTNLAIYSLVNTLAKDGKKVSLTLEGKPISTLGEFDASEPIEANPALNVTASAGSK